MTAPNQFPVVRPSQRLRNLARAMQLSQTRSEGDYPTNADALEEIARTVAENEERQAEQFARIAELEEEKIIASLKRVPSAEYPPELLAARRRRFVAEIRSKAEIAEIPNTEFGSAAWFAGVPEEEI